MEKKETSSSPGFGLVLGVAIGLALGLLFKEVGFGILVGLGISLLLFGVNRKSE